MVARHRGDLRDQVREDIKQAARQLMARHGTAGLSIRAIAREMNLTGAALYRYYANLDEIITALIVDSFSALADTCERARVTAEGQSYGEQLVAVLLAYRRWAVDHPIDFQLIYGNPIPGYVAPRERTMPPVIRGFSLIVGLIENALQAGELVIQPPYDQPPPETRAQLQTVITQDGYPVSEQAMYLGVVGWGQLHGMIMLELFEHIQPVVGDMDVYYRAQVRNLLYTLGLKLAA